MTTVVDAITALAPVHYWKTDGTGGSEADTGSGTPGTEVLDGSVIQHQTDDTQLVSYVIFAEGANSGSNSTPPDLGTTETYIVFFKILSDTITAGLGCDFLWMDDGGSTTYRRMGLTTDGKPFLTVDGTTVTASSAAALGWHMAAAYVTPTGIRLRVDGADVGSASSSPSSHTGVWDWHWHGTAFTDQAHVAVSNIAYWNSALTDTQADGVWTAYTTTGGGGGGSTATIGTRLSWDGGLQVATDGSADFEPAVDTAPTPVAERIVAVTVIDSVTMSGTAPVISSREASKPRARTRIVVGGKDVTYFRGVQTPDPTYGLVSPLLYGSGTLALPQIHAAFERPGQGALTWLRKFAKVKVQRVDSDDNVVATDYRGFISDFQHSGRDFTCTLGGQATGLAAMQDRPVPIFPLVTDIGPQAMRTIRHQLRLPTANEPTTGIEVAETGGGSQLDFLTDLTAKSTQRDGDQWTIMPNSNGDYRMFQKDTSTIDATAYIDGFRVAESLRRDFTEEPNRVWATSVTPEGMRNRFGIYPGLTTSARPAFPGTLSPGDTGSGVTALIWRLFTIGYLDEALGVTWTTDPDDPVTAAVTDLQVDAGLNLGGGTVAGVVDADTWDALFDSDVTGYSLRRSQIKPAAQKPFTQAFLRTASGQIRKPNPKYDRTKPLVDVSVDMGAGWTRRQTQKWAQRELADPDVSNWVGTITVNTGAVIDGEHNPGDSITADDVRDARSIKPGMNLWLPNWDGGTLVHVSGVTVQPGSVEFAVDTRARDTMKVWEVLSRNRESRRNPARQWIAENRSSRLGRDAMTGWDEIGGTIDDRVTCPADTWTVFPVVAGQQGQIRGLKIQTVNDAALFGLAVFGKRITGARLDNLIGDPLTQAGTDAWRHKHKTLQDDHWLLFSAGTKDQPLGYWPEQLPVGGGTPPDVTGEHRDFAGFPYFCVNQPVLWVAIRPDRDTHLEPGRIMWVQLDDQAI